MTDVELISNIKNGDMEAFETLIERHRNNVFRLAYHFLKRTEDIEDVSQEVFLKVFRAIPSWKQEAEFSKWLSTITGNLCIDYNRKYYRHEIKNLYVTHDRGHRKKISIVDILASKDDSQLKLAENNQLAERIRSTLNGFTERQRTILMDRLNGYKYEEIADRLGITSGTTRVHARRTMLKMREALADFELWI